MNLNDMYAPQNTQKKQLEYQIGGARKLFLDCRKKHAHVTTLFRYLVSKTASKHLRCIIQVFI